VAMTLRLRTDFEWFAILDHPSCTNGVFTTDDRGVIVRDLVVEPLEKSTKQLTPKQLCFREPYSGIFESDACRNLKWNMTQIVKLTVDTMFIVKKIIPQIV